MPGPKQKQLVTEEENECNRVDLTPSENIQIDSNEECIVESNGCSPANRLTARQIDFDSAEVISQMDSLTVSDKNSSSSKCSNGTGDGNDSGVDTGATTMGAVTLQRALSNNSAGYASSSGGLDAQFASCNSSLLSVYSESNDGKQTVISFKANIDCTSEGGSESSSVSGAPASKRQTAAKKRVCVTESPQLKSSRKLENPVAKCRSRAASANRAAVQRNSGGPMLATTERARSRDKPMSPNLCNTAHVKRSSSMRRPSKPDSLPSNLRDVAPMQRVTSLSRTPSVTRRTPNCTPSTEDGRWPSTGGRGGNKNYSRNGPSTPENLVIKTKAGPIILENKAIVEKPMTLPRRKKVKSEEDLSEQRSSRSKSITRDRMTSSTVVRRMSSKESTPTKQSHPPKAQKSSPKTIIYHETSIQTALTSQDIDNAFAGNAKEIQINATTMDDKESQVDIRDKEIERLEDKIHAMRTENTKLQENLTERSQLLATLEQQLAREREEKAAMKKELQSNTERVLSMLELVHAVPTSNSEANCDSLLMLESQIQLSGHALQEKQCEINTLRSFCKELQAEMNRSIQVQQTLLEERKCFEKETTELQDFLQDEKSAIVEALKEAEAEIEQYQSKLTQKEQDVERLQDECRHLVRISEQRRQEYLGMQSKYVALESKSKNMVVQQNNAVSGATLALSDLGTRLNSLVEQLISSYSISEQELEDLIYHNEIYANSSEESSPDYERVRGKQMVASNDGSISPQRHQSFIAAVINAIKCAASTAKQSVHKKTNGDAAIDVGDDLESDTTEMLDSETEPCLMMENVLEDVSMPDSHSHNMVSSTNSMSIALPLRPPMDKEEESLHNLCEAIANRQKIEQQANLMLTEQNDHNVLGDASEHESIDNIPSISEQQFPVQILVDHVINVDNLVTKLLKVLRIIQIDNDNCIQQLIAEKNSLQLNKEETMEKMKDWEQTNLKLKNDLEMASKQLVMNCHELTNSKVELQKRRLEINKLNEDICRLSTLCSQTEQRSVISKDEILNTLKRWQDHKEIPEQDIISYICAICQEIPPKSHEHIYNENFTKDLSQCDQQSRINTNAFDVDVKNQNEAISRTIETLNGIQSIVRQCPALVDLQRDLELMLPADCNANANNSPEQSQSKLSETAPNVNHTKNLST